MTVIGNRRKASLEIFFLVFIITTYAENPFPTIDPLETTLSSNDSIGEFFCNGHRSLEDYPLEIKIDLPIIAPPEFRWRKEPFNSTTIKISIFPNGFIGRNRLVCSWKNQSTWGATHDLTIGARPSRIQLKERCEAFDRRYVQCIFLIPTIGRAYRNGFDRDYSFVPLNRIDAASYTEMREHTNISENNELIVRFKTTIRRMFFRKMSMMLNMSIGKFGSANYNFSIDPVHKTYVDYSFGTRSRNQIILIVNHTNEYADDRRHCLGHVSELDAEKRPRLIQNISSTSDLRIELNHLRSSTTYKICLRCYYDENDVSFKDEVCQTTETLSDEFIKTTSIYVLFASLLIVFIGFGFYVFWKCKDQRQKRSSSSQKTISEVSRIDPLFTSLSVQPDDEESSQSLIEESTNENDSKYEPYTNGGPAFDGHGEVAPDTIDLRPEREYEDLP